MLIDFTCIPVIFKLIKFPAIEKVMHIIDAVRLSVAFTQEYKGNKRGMYFSSPYILRS